MSASPSQPDQTYIVRGMTCDHCATAVAEEVTDAPGVASVAVDRAGGRMVVRGESVDTLSVLAAVAAAGYEAERLP